MKLFKTNIFTICFGILVFTGCNEDSFLEEINPNSVTADIFWKSERQYNAALTTAYGALQFQSVSGGELQYEMALGDICGTESWYRPTAFRNLTFNDGTYHVTDKWNQLYVGIFRANQVIENIQSAEDGLFSDNAKAEIEGQARFLRAFFYFQLAYTYGGGVIHTNVAETNEELAKSFSSIDDINNMVIIPDLEFAQKSLPQTWDTKNMGRATWGAATSLLGKIYLYEEDYPKAADLFNDVIESNVYSLTQNISDNFWHQNEFNSESIFEVNFSSELSPGASGAIVDDNAFETGAESSALATAVGQLNYGAFNTILPTYYLQELFLNDEVDVNNPISVGTLESKRMNVSIATKNSEGLYYGLDFADVRGFGFGQSSYVKKHSNWYHLDAEPANSRSGINFRHIRYADVLLMYAEAVIGATSDYAKAIQYIDMVRSRAGVVTLQQYMEDNSGSFPQLHVSKQVHGIQPMITPSAQTVLTHLQRVERPLELCFEGHRWKDLVRWGIVAEVFNDLRADEIWRETNKETVLQVNDGGVAPLFIEARIRPDFFLSSQNYNPAQHNYFPIPTQEAQTNPNINN